MSKGGNEPDHDSPGAARLWLQQELVRRKQKNPAFSLRSFSRLLDIPSGRLSELLNDRRPLTLKAAAKIAARLGYSPRVTARFIATVPVKASAKPTRGEVPARQTLAYHALSFDAFEAIAEWQHFAILSLLETTGFRSDDRWIARRLRISRIEVKAALERLARLGLIETTRNGVLRPTQARLTTTHDVSSAALRRSHRQSLEQAITALDEVELDQRDITSSTMAVDPDRLPQAKIMIRDFRRTLARFLEGGDRREVFNLNVQLVPVTDLKPTKETVK